jgi:hypothetical protein
MHHHTSLLYQRFKEELTQILFKLFPTTEEEEHFLPYSIRPALSNQAKALQRRKSETNTPDEYR